MKRICCMYGSWINNNTDRTLDVVFSRVRVAVAQRSHTHAALNYKTEKNPVSCPPPLTQIRKK